jgi:hypothetical protein
MEEFDIELDSDIGTSVEKIKNKKYSSNDIIKHTETDIDYDKVMEILHNSETKNTTVIAQQPDTFNGYVQDARPKRQINMNQIVKNIENNLDNYNKNNEFNDPNKGPVPVNFTKNMINSTNPTNPTNPTNLNNQVSTLKIKSSDNIQIEPTKKHTGIFRKIVSEYLDIGLYVLIFMLLNNKFIIEFIYNNIPWVKSIQSPYPNLIIRSVVFGVLIFLIKKFNL